MKIDIESEKQRRVNQRRAEENERNTRIDRQKTKERYIHIIVKQSETEKEKLNKDFYQRTE